MTKYQYEYDFYDSFEEALEEALQYIDESELVSLWNEYCFVTKDFDSVIREMVHFDDYCCNMSPSEVVRNLASTFDIHQEYFIDSASGFKSFEYADFIVDYFELACWLADKMDVYECSAFSEIEEVDDSDNE